MKNYIFSALNNAFYPLSLKSRYVEASTWPEDEIEVDDEIFKEFTGEPPTGKVRGVDNGLPCWIDIPPPTQEESNAINRRLQAELRTVADSEIEWRQDAVDAGISTEKESAALAEWKKYRVLLMRVDVDTADPEWPTPPGEQAS